MVTFLIYFCYFLYGSKPHHHPHPPKGKTESLIQRNGTNLPSGKAQRKYKNTSGPTKLFTGESERNSGLLWGSSRHRCGGDQ